MRSQSIILMLAFAAGVAYARDLRGDVDEDGDFLEDIEEEVEPEDEVQLKCSERATGPKFHCWLRSTKYKSQPRQEKLDTIWNHVVGHSTEPEDFLWENHDQFFTQRAQTTFCANSDSLTRRKTTHTQGVVAKVEYIPTDGHTYTGLFSQYSDTIIMRLSETQNLTKLSTGLHPSIALKFLVDSFASDNIVAMESFIPSNSWDFFDATLSNRVPEFDLNDKAQYIMDQTLRKKMVEGAMRPFGTGVGHIASTRLDGSGLTKDETKSPFQIFFKSPLKGKMAQTAFSENGPMWYESIVDTADVGDLVYEVFAQSDKDEPEQKIGELRLLTKMQTSKWADQKLFFQHRRISRDRKYWPKESRNHDTKFERTDDNVFGRTTPDWPSDPVLAKEKFIDQVKTWGCPFEWLMPADWFSSN